MDRQANCEKAWANLLATAKNKARQAEVNLEQAREAALRDWREQLRQHWVEKQNGSLFDEGYVWISDAIQLSQSGAVHFDVETRSFARLSAEAGVNYMPIPIWNAHTVGAVVDAVDKLSDANKLIERIKEAIEKFDAKG